MCVHVCVLACVPRLGGVLAAVRAVLRKRCSCQYQNRSSCLLSPRPSLTALPSHQATAPACPHMSCPQAQAFERRLFTADQPAPPSQLREGRTLLQVGLGQWGAVGGSDGRCL